MKRILLTGMSGTGKSTVIRKLAARGYKAVDADGDEFSQWVEVIVERLCSRTTNQYGKRPDEVARVLSLVGSVEPLLRRAAGYEIDTSVPLEEVVATLLRLVQSQP